METQQLSAKPRAEHDQSAELKNTQGFTRMQKSCPRESYLPPAFRKTKSHNGFKTQHKGLLAKKDTG